MPLNFNIFKSSNASEQQMPRIVKFFSKSSLAIQRDKEQKRIDHKNDVLAQRVMQLKTSPGEYNQAFNVSGILIESFISFKANLLCKYSVIFLFSHN